MKKSELMSYLVYAIILAVIVLVGLFAVRPIMTEYAAFAPLNSIVFIILAIVVGGLFNAVLVELGHLLGALIGHYKVYSWIVFWLGFAEKDGKMKKRPGVRGGVSRIAERFRPEKLKESMKSPR